jgi:hypothetical protein
VFSDAANNRYTIQTVACFSVYSGINAAAMGGGFTDLKGVAFWALFVGLAAPIACHIWATLALIQNADEYARALAAKRFIVAAGICITLFSAWGFMESYAGARHAPGRLLYPAFWIALVGPASFVRSSR